MKQQSLLGPLPEPSEPAPVPLRRAVQPTEQPEPIVAHTEVDTVSTWTASLAYYLSGGRQ